MRRSLLGWFVLNATTVGLAMTLSSSPLKKRVEALEAKFDDIESIQFAFLPESRRFERLERQAEELDKRKQDEDLPLYGMTLGVKDVFMVRGLPTRAGSQLPPEAFCRGITEEESPVVSQLKAAGCLVVGKTVTAELANMVAGPTRNPLNPRYSPGGSSSGSAAAVASGLVDCALGTQTIGSVNRPAAYCGIVGFKPTYGKLSTAGLVTNAPSLDTVGLFARTVNTIHRIAAILLQFEHRSGDKTTDANSERIVVGVPNGAYLEQADSSSLECFRDTIQRLQNSSLFDVKQMDDVLMNIERIRQYHLIINERECFKYHTTNFQEHMNMYHSNTQALFKRGEQHTDEQLNKARALQLELRKQLMDVMKQNRIQVWLTPAAPGLPPKIDEFFTGNPMMQLPWTFAGMPTLNLPSGVDAETGLPRSLQLIAPWNEDESLLSIAAKVEDTLT